MDILHFTFRLVVACGLGMLIGLERELHHKAAGLKTNTLVAAGAAIYVLLSMQLISQGPGDITRIIGQVVTGVGFLCAGVILRQGMNIHGLTTAATVWCSSAVGSMAAAGFVLESVISGILVVAINFVFRKLENVTQPDNDDIDPSKPH